MFRKIIEIIEKKFDSEIADREEQKEFWFSVLKKNARRANFRMDLTKTEDRFWFCDEILIPEAMKLSKKNQEQQEMILIDILETEFPDILDRLMNPGKYSYKNKALGTLTRGLPPGTPMERIIELGLEESKLPGYREDVAETKKSIYYQTVLLPLEKQLKHQEKQELLAKRREARKLRKQNKKIQKNKNQEITKTEK